MKIIFFSDKNYEYQAKSLIESIRLNVHEQVQLIYYTIGFESDLKYENLTKRVYPIDISKPRFEFYKPSILLDAIDTFGGKFLFLDTDMIVGRRFDISKIDHDYDFPLLSQGNWDYPFVSISGENSCDEQNLMKYFGVEKRTMNYVYSCMVSFNDKCRDIILEWASMCDNKYLLKNRSIFLPFHDETPINIILWKRGININLGRIYLNNLDYNPLVYVEENDNIVGDPSINYGILDSSLMRCENSNNIILYHGIKDNMILRDVLLYFEIVRIS